MSVSLLSRAEKDKGYVTEKNPEKKNVRITQTHRHTDAHTESHTHTQAVKKHRQRHTDTIATSVTPTQNPPPLQKKKDLSAPPPGTLEGPAEWGCHKKFQNVS